MCVGGAVLVCGCAGLGRVVRGAKLGVGSCRILACAVRLPVWTCLMPQRHEPRAYCDCGYLVTSRADRLPAFLLHAVMHVQ